MERDSARNNLIAGAFCCARGTHAHRFAAGASAPPLPEARGGVAIRSWRRALALITNCWSCRTAHWVPVVTAHLEIHATPREFELLHIVVAASPRQRH